MSSIYEVPVDPAEETLSAKNKRIIPGSAMTICFDPTCQFVVMGYSKKSIQERGCVWKCPCGRPEASDVPDFEARNAALLQFTRCAHRERQNETGLRDEDFQVIEPLKYVRFTHPRFSNGEQIGASLQQWHFVGLLKPGVVLPKNAIESDEMGDPEYWDVINVLRLPRWGEKVPQSQKVNPYHQLAIAKCIIELRDANVAQLPQFAGLKELLLRIYESGTEIDNYVLDLHRRILLGEI